MNTAYRVLLVGVLLLAARAPLAAQGGEVYPPEELTERPALRSPTRTAEMIRSAYPPELKRQGVAGTVQLSFIVDEQGKVDPASVKVVSASEAAFGDAARKVIPALEFRPGKKGTTAVRTQVVLPISFR